MENWKERFEYIYVIEENKGEKYLRKYDHTTIVEELEYFISQELDKAREEGFKKGYIDGQIEKRNKPKPVVSEFDKTSYLN